MSGNSGHSRGETPGLIPNPEVKPSHVPGCTEVREPSGSPISCYYLPFIERYSSSLLILPNERFVLERSTRNRAILVVNHPVGAHRRSSCGLIIFGDGYRILSCPCQRKQRALLLFTQILYRSSAAAPPRASRRSPGSNSVLSTTTDAPTYSACSTRPTALSSRSRVSVTSTVSAAP